MSTENTVLMERARESLKGNWGLAIATVLVSILASTIPQVVPKVGPFAALFISAPLYLGFIIFSLSMARRQNARLEMLFHGFRNYGTALGAYLLVVLFTLLWTLLLIIPGIIASFSYAMTFFIIADNPAIGPMEAIKQSKAMMYGYRVKYLCLGLRFFGWMLLCLLTLGIGFLWLWPYIMLSLTHFYEDIKDNPIAREAK